MPLYESEKQPCETSKGEEKKEVKPEDRLVTTHHTIRINGQEFAYTATIGTLVLKQESEGKDEKAGEFEGEKPRAEIFFVAYTRDDAPDPARRPLTFAFNGGPGSSSVWLHMGMLGPRRVLLDPDGNPLPPPGLLVDNEYSLLDRTDLVFIDPVTTGYSRPVVGEKAGQFHGYKKDIEAVGDFIRLYVTRNRRWASPKFLAGESYGTTRAVGLSDYLLQRHGLFLNGLMLVSTALDFSTLRFHPGNELPFILHLPTYAATAWYHHCLQPDLQRSLPDTLRQAEAFASDEYLRALFEGDALDPARKAEIVTRLAAFTGLSEDYIRSTNLRVEIMRFTKELLRAQRRTVGRLDSRFTGMDRDAAGERYEQDPSYIAILGPYTAMLNDYVRRELGFESDLPYEVLTDRVRPWSFAENENSYVMLGETLRKAMSSNPHMLVWVACGYYDLATPYYAARYVFSHLQIEPELFDHITIEDYEAGHMIYIHMPSLQKLRRDLDAFFDKALLLSR